LLRHPLQDRAEGAAGTAPRRPQVHDHRAGLGLLHHLLCEVRVGDLDDDRALSHSLLHLLHSFQGTGSMAKRLSRSELASTETDDIAIAAPAMIGFRRPNAASGMAAAL